MNSEAMFIVIITVATLIAIMIGTSIETKRDNYKTCIDAGMQYINGDCIPIDNSTK